MTEHDLTSYDEFGIVLPMDAGAKAVLRGLTNPAALDIPINGTHLEQHWPTVNLADPQYAIPPDPPAIAGLLYEGKRHVCSGPQESAKTLIAYHLLLLALRTGVPVAIVDLEMGPVATRRMLHDLGATPAELANIHYTEPNGPPTSTDIETLTQAGVRYVLIDAAAGAFDLTGLDDNSRKDAEKWARAWVDPMFKLGISTIVLDHVTKNSETRGKYAIGSERKTGGADVHLGFEALKTLTRGGTGLVKVSAHKDRGAYMQRPTVALIKLESHPDTHQVTVTIEPPEVTTTDQGEFRHTIYMERVSRTLETTGEPMSQRQIEDLTEGGREYIHKAIHELVADDHATITTGPRNAKIITLIKPYRRPTDDLPATSPPPTHGEVTSPPPHLPTPLQGVGSVGRSGDDIPTTNDLPTAGEDKLNLYDPTIQHLLDDPDY